MEVFFSPIKHSVPEGSGLGEDGAVESGDNLRYKCYPNFSYVKLCDLNILCDCPLISKSDIDAEANEELLNDLGLGKIHQDTLFPIAFLFNTPCSRDVGSGGAAKIKAGNSPETSDDSSDLSDLCFDKINRYKEEDDAEGIDERDESGDASDETEDIDFFEDEDDQEEKANEDLLEECSEDSCFKYSENNEEDEDSDVDCFEDCHVNFENRGETGHGDGDKSESHQEDKNTPKSDGEKINIDLILITNPAGLTGIPFLLYYNNFEKDNYDRIKSNNHEQNSIKLGNLYEWILKFPSKFNITNSILLITPHVYQASLIGIQQLIEYNSDDLQKDYNDIVDPFIDLKTSDLYNMLFNITKDESLDTRSRIFDDLQENRLEYLCKDSDFSSNFVIQDKHNNTMVNSKRTQSALKSTITTSSHIFDGNITQNIPGTIGCNTSNTCISNPPLFGNLSGEEMSFYPRMLFEDKYLINSFSNNNKKSFICSSNRSFEIRIVHIGELIEIEKSICKFEIHAFNSGFSLGSVGFHISVRNVDFDPNKPHNNVTILGPTCIELDRYPAPLNLNDLLKSNYLIYYGNYFNFTQNKCNLSQDSKSETNTNNNVVVNHSSIYLSQINEIIKNIISTINNSGSVLIPIDCFGLHCFEIVELIGQRISEISLSKQVPIYIVGGGLSSIILHGDISSEWTSYTRSRKSMLPNPSPPFLFSFLKKSNRLYIFHDMKELSSVYREPGVFLASNSDLKYGPCIELFRILNKRTENTLIFIDSYIYFDTLFKNITTNSGVKMKILYIPLYIEPNIYDLFNTVIPYFDQHKFDIIIPDNKPITHDLNDSTKKLKNNIISIPITRDIVFNKQSPHRIFNFNNNWLPVTLSYDLINLAMLRQIDDNTFISKANCNFYFSEGEIVVDKNDSDDESNSTNDLSSEIELFKCAFDNIEMLSDEDEHISKDENNDDGIDDDQIILFGKITVKSLINQLKNNNINDFILNFNDEFLDKKGITSITISSLSCKIIILSSSNFLIDTKNHNSRETIYNIISSLLICA